MKPMTAAERELMAEAIPLWKEWCDEGLSLTGSMLPFVYGYIAHAQRSTSAASMTASTPATKGAIPYNERWAPKSPETKTAAALLATETTAYVTQEGKSQ